MKKTLLILAAIAALSACSSRSDAEAALSKAGFTNIETHGFSLFGCSEDDGFRTKFTATNTQGQRVDGVVCSGFFKGSTIRF